MENWFRTKLVLAVSYILLIGKNSFCLSLLIRALRKLLLALLNYCFFLQNIKSSPSFFLHVLKRLNQVSRPNIRYIKVL